MPKIAYVCEECWNGASEASCWEDRHELRVMPDCCWLCQCCWDANRPMSEEEDALLPQWSALPVPPEYVSAV